MINEQVQLLIDRYEASSRVDAATAFALRELRADNERLRADNKRLRQSNSGMGRENRMLRDALCRISLDSQSSMGSRDECGRIARTALAATETPKRADTERG
jgi:hypothetical protein